MGRFAFIFRKLKAQFQLNYNYRVFLKLFWSFVLLFFFSVTWRRDINKCKKTLLVLVYDTISKHRMYLS